MILRGDLGLHRIRRRGMVNFAGLGFSPSATAAMSPGRSSSFVADGSAGSSFTTQASGGPAPSVISGGAIIPAGAQQAAPSVGVSTPSLQQSLAMPMQAATPTSSWIGAAVPTLNRASSIIAIGLPSQVRQPPFNTRSSQPLLPELAMPGTPAKLPGTPVAVTPPALPTRDVPQEPGACLPGYFRRSSSEPCIPVPDAVTPQVTPTNTGGGSGYSPYQTEPGPNSETGETQPQFPGAMPQAGGRNMLMLLAAAAVGAYLLLK